MARNKIYLKKYQALFEKEIIAHFGSITDCEKVCHVQRSNIYKAITPGNGYISEKMLHSICRKMDLSPLCFIDDPEKHPFHNSFYNEEYKMTFEEYEQLSISRQLRTVDKHRAIYPPEDAILKIIAGLTDQELAMLPSEKKSRMLLMVSKTVDAELEGFIPDWIKLI